MKKTLLLLLLAFGTLSVQAQKLVALSFDDGPNMVTTPAMLAKLYKHQVVATFFIWGNMVTPESELMLKLEVQQGHEIGNHSFTHSHMTTLSADSIRKEIDMTTHIIERVTSLKSATVDYQ